MRSTSQNILSIVLIFISFSVFAQPWKENQIISSNGAYNDGFGRAVSISRDGKSAVVGASYKSNKGAVYFYKKVDTVWTEVASFYGVNTFDAMGGNVAMSPSGDFAFVSAVSYDVGNNNNQGLIYYYKLINGVWTASGTITPADGVSQNFFGGAISISGDSKTLIISSPGDGSRQGKVYIYIYNGNLWTLQTSFSASDGAKNDVFGWDVDLSEDGNTAVVGAHKVGKVYIYNRVGSAWTETKIFSLGGYFGFTVKLTKDGNTLMVGDNIADEVQTQRGKVYVFDKTGGVWSQSSYLVGDGLAYNNFGCALDISFDGNIAVVGAAAFYSNGAAYVFKRTSTANWTRIAKLVPSDTRSEDDFGINVSASYYGSTILVGGSSQTVGTTAFQGKSYFYYNGTPLPGPEILVKGNKKEILDENTPSLLDSTDFGAVQINTSSIKKYVIKNTGTQSLTIKVPATVSGKGFSIVQQPSANVAVGDSTSIGVQYLPTNNVPQAGELILENSDGDESFYNIRVQSTGLGATIGVYANGIPIPKSNVTFQTSNNTYLGSPLLNTTSTFTYTIKNLGILPLTITSPILVSSRSSYKLARSPSKTLINPNDSTTFDLNYTPTDNSTTTGYFYVYSSDTQNQTFIVFLRGTGSGPDISVKGNKKEILDGTATVSVEDSTSWGGVVVGNFTSRNYKIYNLGLTPLSITSNLVSGAGFSITRQPISPIAPGDSTFITVRFSPLKNYTVTGTLNIYSNDTDESPYNFNLFAFGIGPDIAISGNGIDIPKGKTTTDFTDSTNFGTVVRGTSIVRRFVIKNNGITALTISPNVSVSNSFFVLENQPSTLVGPGDSTFVRIRFAPDYIINATAYVTINNDDQDENLFQFSIRGTGTEPEIQVKGNNLDIFSNDVTPTTTDGTDFGKVNQGISLSRTFKVYNKNAGTLYLKLPIQITGAGYSIAAQPSAQVLSNDSTSFTVLFKPQSTTTSIGTVTILNNDYNESTYKFNFRGIGQCLGISTTTISLQTCTGFVWQGTTYTSPGFITKTIKTSFGCDSTVQINLTLNQPTVWYKDVDGDSFGNPSDSLVACSIPSGYVSNKMDKCPTDANKTVPGFCGCGNTELSCIDCSGVTNGTAILDSCFRCAGGTTGITPILNPLNCVLDVQNVELASDWTISPNPGAKFSLHKNSGKADVKIYDQLGVMVAQKEVIETAWFGDSFQSGVYHIIIIENGRTTVLKFIKP